MNKLDPGTAHGLTQENMMAALPNALREDPSMVALADAIAGVLEARREEIDRLRIYPAIDRLEEPLLDILAYDYKVDWWDPEYSLEEKRRTLKDSWRVHKLLGTKAAVVTAISAIYPQTRVEEWFEYGGRPYHFRLCINITDNSADRGKRKQVLSRLDFYKNLRSHTDSITYQMAAVPAHISAGGAALGTYRRAQIPVIKPALRPPGGIGRSGAGTGVLGQRLQMSARIGLPEDIRPPQAGISIRSQTGLAGSYQKIKKEVPIHGTLDAVRGHQ